MRLAAIAFVFPTCRALPPPPTAVGHADPSAAPRGTTTAMVIVGAVSASDGSGIGAAIRVERQVTERTAVALEVAAGKGSEPIREREDPVEHRLLALRVAGRFTPSNETLAVTYGLGISHFSTGLITGSASAGFLLAPDFKQAIPVAEGGLALAVPLRVGKPYGLYYEPTVEPIFTFEHEHHEPPLVRVQEVPPRDARLPRSEVYWYAGFTIIGVVGSTGNRLSLDLDLVRAMREEDFILSASAADAQRFAP